MIRVFIADDHNLFREGIKTLLDKEHGITVVGEAEDGAALLSKYKGAKPDIIITDISMPGKSGPDAIRLITNKDKKIKVLFLSQFTGDDYVYAVLQSKGNGLISKSVLRSELLLAIKTIANGGIYFVGKTAEELEMIKKRFDEVKKKNTKQHIARLTKREKEILLLLSESLSSSDISEKLKISIRTVDCHRMNIINKFRLKALPGLINFARDYALNIKDD